MMISTPTLLQEQVLTDEIKELNQKRSLIDQENKKLHEKITLLHQETAELQKKIYALRSMDESNKNSSPYSFSIDEAPISLQLSQPQPQENDISAQAMKL
ncbi:hypothetical protein Ccrd_010724, partial [Cynara cardunculus var. scolymus]